MANEVTDAVVSIHLKPTKTSHVIRVVNVITNGLGSYLEALQGGQATITLTLTSGTVSHSEHLKEHETVFVRGVENGAPFIFSGSLKVLKAHKPWEFTGKVGSTGP